MLALQWLINIFAVRKSTIQKPIIMKKGLITTLLLSIMVLAQAQNMIIEGYIFSNDQGKYLPDVKVKAFANTNTSPLAEIISNEGGYFRLELPFGKQYVLKAVKHNYWATEIKIFDTHEARLFVQMDLIPKEEESFYSKGKVVTLTTNNSLTLVEDKEKAKLDKAVNNNVNLNVPLLQEKNLAPSASVFAEAIDEEFSAYTVVFLKSDKAISPQNTIFKRHGNLKYDIENGIFYYCIGKFDDSFSAEHFYDQFIKVEYPDAEIVYFKNGKGAYK